MRPPTFPIYPGFPPRGVRGEGQSAYYCCLLLPTTLQLPTTAYYCPLLPTTLQLPTTAYYCLLLYYCCLLPYHGNSIATTPCYC